MANYLARIAAAGIRTSIQAKPPISGPPLLPGPLPSGILYPANVAHSEEVSALSDTPGEPTPPPVSSAVPTTPPAARAVSPYVVPMKSYTTIGEEQPLPPPAPATPATASTQTMPTAQESMHLPGQKPVAIDTTPIIHAPRALRSPTFASEPGVNDVKQGYQKAQPDVHVPPIASTGTSQPSLTSPHNITASTRTMPTAQESMHLPGQKSAAIDAAPIIHAPRALRPCTSTSEPVAAKVHRKELSDVSMLPMASTGTSRPVLTPPHLQERINTIPAASGVSLPREPIEVSSNPSASAAPRVTQPQQSRSPDKATSDQENNMPLTQGVLPLVRTSLMPAEREALPQGAMPPMPIEKGALSQGGIPLMPAASAASRQVKLTIGRLDVRVNNHPPAPSPGRSAPIVSPPATDALEQHSLDRFRLKI